MNELSQAIDVFEFLKSSPVTTGEQIAAPAVVLCILIIVWVLRYKYEDE